MFDQNGLNPAMNELLGALQEGIVHVLGDQLVGLYAYGSLVIGGSNPRISDIDLLGVTKFGVDEVSLAGLGAMHQEIVRVFPAWNNRIEVAYVSLDALRTFRLKASRIGIISPGEPLHFRHAGRDWLMNWYLARIGNATLVGPPPAEVSSPISREEFIEVVLGYAQLMEHRAGKSATPETNAYAILTVCRALYAQRTGQHASKEGAAKWAADQMPEWAPLIHAAIGTRQGKTNSSTVLQDAGDRAAQFVNLVNRLCVGDSSF